MQSSTPAPLKGIRVLDLSSIVAGPISTLTLACLGADVIKVERIGGGDDSRHMGPHLGPWSSVFVPLNRGKRSIAIDPSKPAGRDVILRLVRRSDVLVENLRGGKMAALGLDEESLRAQNPDLIYASISAFGSSGPDALKPGYEALVQGRSGIMSVTGPGPGAMPVRAGVPVIDGSAGMWLTIGILAALYERQRSGRGQRVNTSLLESGVMLMFHNLLGRQFSGSDPVPQGSRYPSFGLEGGSFSPYGAYESSDGWIMIGVSSDKIFRRLCGALKREDWARDPRFSTNVLRVKNRQELNAELQSVLRQHPTSYWKDLFDVHDVPVSAIQDSGQVMNDPQVEANHQLEPVELPGYEGRPIRIPRVPLHLSETPIEDLSLPPELSQHGREILFELGYGNAEIEEMISDRAFKPFHTTADGEGGIAARSHVESQ